MKSILSLALALVLAVAWLAGAPAAQTFRSGVNLIVLQVSVADADGHVVTGLSRDDFSVHEDRIERRIVQFSAEQVPVSLGILMDVSGSMLGRRFEDAQVALGKLLERFQGDDEIFLATFASGFRLVVPWTADHPAILRALRGISPRGGTFLYSSISAALPILNKGLNRKKALVIISDGDDNELMAGLNRPLLERAVQQAQQSEALIYVIGIGQPKPTVEKFLQLDAESRRKLFFDPPVDVETLRMLTNPTGGYTQLVSSTSDLSSTIISIADDLNGQYMLAFESDHADGKYHTLKVATRRGGDTVRSKTGFVIPIP